MKLTDKEKMIIAEFIFSYETDVLIKTDAIAVIQLLEKKEIEGADELTMDAAKIKAAVIKAVTQKEVTSIMADYYSGKL